MALFKGLLLNICSVNGLFLTLSLTAAISGKSQMRQLYTDANADNDVKKISMYSSNEGYISFRFWIGLTSDSGRTYVKKFITNSNVNYNGYSVNLTFGFETSGVLAFNQDTLIVYGDYGFVPAILYSNDKGNTFTLVYQSALNAQHFTGGVKDLVFPTHSNIGYAVEADRIIKTTDRGKHWSSVYESPNSFYDFISAVDNNNLFAYSVTYSNKIVSTNNGGSIWNNINPPTPDIYPTAICFRSANKGWLCGAAHMFYTSDGGVSWTQKNKTGINDFQTSKMLFTNDSTGYATGGLFTVFKTSDSGKVWEPLLRDNQYTYLYNSHYDLQILNNQLWAGGGHGFLEMSTNLGGTPLPKAYFEIDTNGVWQTNIVKLNNDSRPGYQYQWLVNGVQVSSAFNATYTHDLSRLADSISLIVKSANASDTFNTIQYFNIPDLPIITSFSPATGSTGTLVTITGRGFDEVSSVSFGGSAAVSFTIISSSQITAVVGSGATGNIQLTNVHGNYSVPGFTYFNPPTGAAPVISSFSPQSGPVGTVVTLSGANFNPASGNNVVYFGATQATVISASANALTCKVPVGASFQPVTLLNTGNHLSGSSLKAFNITFADSSNFTNSSFKPAYVFTKSNYIYTKDLMGKDIDGDGKPDIVAVTQTWSNDSILIFRNNSTGNNFSFEGAKDIGEFPTNGPGIFDLNDLDGDGKADMVNVLNSKAIEVRRNNSSVGNIAFDNAMQLDCLGASFDVKISDLDNDGRNDIVIANFDAVNGLEVYRNTSVPGFLSFASPKNYRTGGNTVTVAVGDLDGDGKKDLVTNSSAGSGSSNFTCFPNTGSPGNISFGPRIDFPGLGSSPGANQIILADLDNDNKLDVVITSGSNFYCVYRNTSTPGHFSFAPAQILQPQGVGQGGAVANLNGDSKPDYFASGLNDGYITVVRNQSTVGAINFDNPATMGYHTSVYYSNTGDFNGDGKTDILNSDAANNKFVIYSNYVGDSIPVPLCPGSSSEINADLNGTAFQWQEYNGTSFVNITQGANLSDGQLPYLDIINPPASYNGKVLRCMVDGIPSSNFVLKVSSLLRPTVNILVDDSTLCFGQQASFRTSTTNAGPGPTYTWLVNDIYAGSDSSFMSTILKNGDLVKVIVTRGDNCSGRPSDTSREIKMTMTGIQPVITLNASDTTICVGSTVTFTATVNPQMTNATYNWIVNRFLVSNDADRFSTNTLHDGDSVDLYITTTTACVATAQSRMIYMHVKDDFKPEINITAPGVQVCEGDPYVATASTTGALPVGGILYYLWNVNGVVVWRGGSQFSSTTLKNADRLRVVGYFQGNCQVLDSIESGNLYEVSEIILRPSIVITGTTTVNKGDAVDLHAASSNVDPPFSFQWQDSVSAAGWKNVSNLQGIHYQPGKTGDMIRCILQSSGNCAQFNEIASNSLVFTVNAKTDTIVVPPVIPPVTPPDSNLVLKYFPNPVSNILHIQNLKPVDQWNLLKITSMNGDIVMSMGLNGQKEVDINVAYLARGAYVIVLESAVTQAIRMQFVKM